MEILNMFPTRGGNLSKSLDLNPSFENEKMDEGSVDPILVQKMVFVYNALNDGWTVCKKGENKYEFTKNMENESEEMKREINLDDYLRKFLRFHMNIENLSQTRRSGSI
jgi:hypothetical protein